MRISVKTLLTGMVLVGIIVIAGMGVFTYRYYNRPVAAATPAAPVVTEWTTSTYGYRVLWCANDGSYIGYVEQTKGGWWEVYIGHKDDDGNQDPKDEGSYADQASADTALEALAQKACQ